MGHNCWQMGQSARPGRERTISVEDFHAGTVCGSMLYSGTQCMCRFRFTDAITDEYTCLPSRAVSTCRCSFGRLRVT